MAWARAVLEGMRTANAPRLPELAPAPFLKLVPPLRADGELVAEALGSGARARLAEEELYRRYRGAVVRLASSFSELDCDEVDDVVQESFVRAGRVHVRLRVRVCPELVSWILGFGADVRVIEPQSLRLRIARLSREMEKAHHA